MKHYPLIRNPFPGIFLFMILAANTSFAQDTLSHKWHYVLEGYMMFPNMSGQTTVRNLPEVDVDASAGDILGHLNIGAMLYAEATNDNWAITSDFLYMNLGQDAQESNLVTGGDVTMKETCWELAGLKRITPWLDAGVGGRLLSLNAAIDIETLLENRSGSATRTWFDPVIIARSNHIFNEKWILQVRGDLGGFGIGSDFTWQGQVYAGYRFSKLFQATVGYRYIGIDYDKGEGQDRFLYDIDTYGAVIRLGFNFQ
jgi:hypothetical protein